MTFADSLSIRAGSLHSRANVQWEHEAANRRSTDDASVPVAGNEVVKVSTPCVCVFCRRGEVLNHAHRRSDKDIIKGLQEDSFANFLRDGRWIMENDGFVPYVGRVCYLVNRYLLKQTDPTFKFELNPDLLAQSITYKASDGSRRSVPIWEMAPTVQESQDTQREMDRDSSEKRFKEHLFKHGSMIPYTFLHSEWIQEEATKRYGAIVSTEKSRREGRTNTTSDKGGPDPPYTTSGTNKGDCTPEDDCRQDGNNINTTMQSEHADTGERTVPTRGEIANC